MITKATSSGKKNKYFPHLKEVFNSIISVSLTLWNFRLNK